MPLDVGDIAKDIHEALDYVERTVPGADTNKRARLAWAYLAGSLRSRGNFGDRRARDLAHRISKFFGLERAAAASQGRSSGDVSGFVEAVFGGEMSKRQCSTLCAKGEPCSITEDGECDVVKQAKVATTT